MRWIEKSRRRTERSEVPMTTQEGADPAAVRSSVDRARLSPRLALAAVGFGVAAVPTAVLAYAATHGWAPLRDLDQGTADHLHAWAVGQPGAVGALQVVSTALHPWAVRAVAAGAAGWLLLRRQTRLALWVGTAVIGAGVLDYVLKDVVRRVRPVLPDAVASAPGYSFPSGHALTSVVGFGVAVLLVLPLVHGAWRVVVWVVAVGGVLLVGFARVALGVHFVSDVVAGWLLGLGWLALTAAAFESWRRAAGRPAHAAAVVVTEGIDPRGSRAAVREP
jgi:undecaprenyl-diphosphatase